MSDEITVIPNLSQIKFEPIKISKNGPHWQYRDVSNLGQIWNNGYVVRTRYITGSIRYKQRIFCFSAAISGGLVARTPAFRYSDQRFKSCSPHLQIFSFRLLKFLSYFGQNLAKMQKIIFCMGILSWLSLVNH